MRIRDEARETEFYTDDPAIIRKAQKEGSGYSIVSEETVADARRKELSAMKRKELDTIAEPFRITLADFNKDELIEEILLFESGAKRIEEVDLNAPNA